MHRQGKSDPNQQRMIHRSAMMNANTGSYINKELLSWGIAVRHDLNFLFDTHLSHKTRRCGGALACTSSWVANLLNFDAIRTGTTRGRQVEDHAKIFNPLPTIKARRKQDDDAGPVVSTACQPCREGIRLA